MSTTYRRLRLHAFALLAGAFFGVFSAITTPTGASAQTLVDERSSNYNNIFVYKEGPLYTLTFGHNRRFYTETVYDTRDELALPVEYTRFMTVGLAYAKEQARILEIGSGGARTAWYLHKHLPDTQMTTVELDPEVHAVAQKYFGIRDEQNFNVVVQDGRRYLATTNETWDVIMVDAYRGPFVPFHLLTREFYDLVKKDLKPGGVLVQNIEPSTMVFDSALATIQAVFEHVDVYPASGNVVLVGYNGTQLSNATLVERAQALQKKRNFRYSLVDMIGQRRLARVDPSVRALTDDFAPVESLLAIERHNRKLDSFSTVPEK